ncbi:hypothetical protein V8G54_017164 [Vigna mungo]|uniref:Uncharacterized protein n=1 Tax=Vigna mungo TaxID=3915 RepID=A0AAQ3S1Y4_VIGMU
MSSNGSSSSVFNGNCSVSHTDGRKLLTNSFSLVCGTVTLAEDLRGGGAVPYVRSTLFLPIGTHSLSSRTKLLCLLLSGMGNPKLGFSATRKPSSSSSSSNGSTCSLPATSDSQPATFLDRKLKTTLCISYTFAFHSPTLSVFSCLRQFVLPTSSAFVTSIPGRYTLVCEQNPATSDSFIGPPAFSKASKILRSSRLRTRSEPGGMSCE